jgi:hypothetical protein
MAKATNNNSKPKKAVKKQSSPKYNKDSGGGRQRILDLLLAIEMQSGNVNVPRKMVASQVGIKDSTFAVTISIMKNKHDLIDYDKETIHLTDKGRSKAVPAKRPLDNETAQKEIMERYKLGGSGMAGLLFKMLLDGQVHDRQAVSSNIGCTNKGTIAVLLSKLKKSQVIEYDRNTIRLSDKCFPYGRPSIQSP